MKRVTIEDVAKAAGVSRQTVSRAINDKDEISPETRDRVLAAVQQLGYRPNRLAQGMVTQRTSTVGLVVPDITNPFFPEVARGVQDKARQNDYNMFLCNTEEAAELELQTLESLAAQPVDGIIIFAEHASDEEIINFAEQYHPLVLINRQIEHPHISSVYVDITRAAEQAVRYFVNQGHTQLGMITRDFEHHHTHRREAGFVNVLQEHDLDLDPSHIRRAPATLEGGYEAAKLLLTESPEITAVFAYNDIMAMGALRACRDLGRQVPHDCAIIGFDDIRLASISSPSLSTVRIDKYELGRAAISRLLEMLQNPTQQFMPLELPVQLMLRESTLPPVNS